MFYAIRLKTGTNFFRLMEKRSVDIHESSSFWGLYKFKYKETRDQFLDQNKHDIPASHKFVRWHERNIKRKYIVMTIKGEEMKKTSSWLIKFSDFKYNINGNKVANVHLISIDKSEIILKSFRTKKRRDIGSGVSREIKYIFEDLDIKFVELEQFFSNSNERIFLVVQNSKNLKKEVKQVYAKLVDNTLKA